MTKTITIKATQFPSAAHYAALIQRMNTEVSCSISFPGSVTMRMRFDEMEVRKGEHERARAIIAEMKKAMVLKNKVAVFLA